MTVPEILQNRFVGLCLSKNYFYHSLNYNPQIENTNASYLNDTSNWMLISGNFIATGGERFMTIGNFRSSINTFTQYFNYRISPWAYYYIDDISVIYCDPSAINEMATETNINIYPNPITDKLNITIDNNELTEITLYDLSSRKILQQTFTNTTTITAAQITVSIQSITIIYLKSYSYLQIYALVKLTPICHDTFVLHSILSPFHTTL